MQRAGSEMPAGQSPYSSLKQKDNKKKELENQNEELRRRGHLLAFHTHRQAVRGGGACGRSSGSFNHMVRSMNAPNADQSLTTPHGVGISE